jgi:hypothetical protein
MEESTRSCQCGNKEGIYPAPRAFKLHSVELRGFKYGVWCNANTEANTAASLQRGSRNQILNGSILHEEDGGRFGAALHSCS